MVVDCLNAMVVLRDCEKTSARDKISICKDLLDRGLGKTAPGYRQLETKEESTSFDKDFAAELEDIERQLLIEQDKASI